MKEIYNRKIRESFDISHNRTVGIKSIEALKCGFLQCKGDGSWTLLHATDEFYNIIGYTKEEFFSQLDGNLINLIDESEKERVLKELDKQITESGKGSLRYKIKNGHGKNIIVLDSFSRIDENEAPFYYCTYTDITGQIEQVTEIEEWKSKFQKKIDSLDQYFWEYDIKNNCFFNGYRALFDFGIPKEAASHPETLLEAGIIHPDSYVDFISLHSDMKIGKKISKRHIRFNSEDGKPVWYDVKYTNFYDEQGNPDTAFATAQSLNEYKAIEQHFNTLANQMQMHIWTYNVAEDTVILSDNEFDEIFNGNEIHDPKNNPILINRLFSEDIPVLRDIIDRIRNDEDVPSQTIKFLGPVSGKVHWIKVTSSYIRNFKGEPIKAVGAFLDVSAKVSLEERISVLSARRNTDADRVVVSFWINLTRNTCGGCNLACSGILKKYNINSADKLFDYAQQRLSDKGDIDKFQSFLSRDKLIKLYREGQTSYEIELRFSAEKNSHRWLKIILDIMKNPSTGDIEVLSYATDIDHDKVTETVIENVVDANYEYVAVVDLRKATFEIVGKSSKYNILDVYEGLSDYDDLVRKYASRYVIEEDRREFLECLNLSFIRKKIRLDKKYSFLYRVKLADGRVHFKRTSFLYVDETRDIAGVTRNDVTEEMLQQQEKTLALSYALSAAEKANNAKSLFLANMSHSIRTPMNAIINMAQFSLKEIDDPETVEKNLEVILESSQSLLRLINNVLEMSRIESGDNSEVIEKFKLIDVCCEVESILKPQCEIRNQLYMSDFTSICQTETVKGDRQKIKKILLSLLSNAVEYTPDNGHISFCAAEWKSFNHGVVNVRFEIQDNGIGIEKERQIEIFEPFNRAEFNFNKYTSEGSGLGLSIVKSYLDMMNGKISISSTPGEGSLFAVDIPLQIEEEDRVKEKGTEKFDVKSYCMGKKALLVEDNEINQMVVCKLLKNVQFDVETASNGKEGVEKFFDSEAGTYDLILMDIKMPIMNGYEAARKIRSSEHPQARSIPIIATTANVFSEDVNEAVRNGMTDHISKPINAGQFYEVISKYL